MYFAYYISWIEQSAIFFAEGSPTELSGQVHIQEGILPPYDIRNEFRYHPLPLKPARGTGTCIYTTNENPPQKERVFTQLRSEVVLPDADFPDGLVDLRRSGVLGLPL